MHCESHNRIKGKQTHQTTRYSELISLEPRNAVLLVCLRGPFARQAGERFQTPLGWSLIQKEIESCFKKLNEKNNFKTDSLV